MLHLDSFVLTCEPRGCATRIHLGINTDYLITFLSGGSHTCIVITDTQVRKLYGMDLIRQLESARCRAKLFAIEAGETYKTRETLTFLQNHVLQYGCDQNTLLIALGGGVISDITGFLAATLLRGLPWVVIPTTLLGMVDASIGGKTGVNTPWGKNLIGCIHHPRDVLIDLHYLTTLPHHEWVSGFAEVIKYAVTLDASLFAFLEDHVTQSPHTLSETVVYHLIKKSCEHKTHLVAQDPFDRSFRKVLNFGHTIGHALEHTERYRISHGEAVAMGMLTESYISMVYHQFLEEELLRLKRLLQAYGFSLRLTSRPEPSEWRKAVQRDKKSLNNTSYSIVLSGIGSVHPCASHYATPLNAETLDKAYHWMCKEFC